MPSSWCAISANSAPDPQASFSSRSFLPQHKNSENSYWLIGGLNRYGAACAECRT
jgi:hypothetical protein